MRLLTDILKEKTERFYCVKQHNGTLVFVLKPYAPFCKIIFPYGDIDNYYIASHALYLQTKQLISELISIGFSVEQPPVLLKTSLFQGGFCSMGSNTLCFVSGYGSYFTMQAFFVRNVFIDYGDKYSAAACGDCKICERACPAGAIKNGVFDRSKCIRQYMETGIFTREQGVAFSNKVFGCTECQRCCPKNSHIKSVVCEDEYLEYLRLDNLLLSINNGRKGLKYLADKIGVNYARAKYLLPLAQNAIRNMQG